MVPALFLHVPANLGYAGLALLVGLESSGLPVPGETALITAAVLSSQGHLSIEVVIATAAAAAILGDNLGYALSRRFGRTLMLRPGLWYERRWELFERGERFFARHGPKAVFFGRWIAGLRVWASWLAGMTGTGWPTFVLWNALGGIAWATTVGIAGYALGAAARHLFAEAGLVAALALVIAFAAASALGHHRRRRGRTPPGDAPHSRQPPDPPSSPPGARLPEP